MQLIITRWREQVTCCGFVNMEQVISDVRLDNGVIKKKAHSKSQVVGKQKLSAITVRSG